MRRPSSRALIKALEADGFTAPRPAKGSHRAYTKKIGDRTVVVVAIIGKKEIPAGTMRSILEQWGIDEDRFGELLGR